MHYNSYELSSKKQKEKKPRNSQLKNIEIHTVYQENLMCEEVFLVKN